MPGAKRGWSNGGSSRGLLGQLLGGGGICLAEGKGDVQAAEVVPGVPELCAFLRNGHVVSVD